MYLLLVDQNTVTSIDLKEIIGRSLEGAEIVNCYTTDTLLKLTEMLDPDLVVVDFSMVAEEYSQLFLTIREKNKNIQIIPIIEHENYEELYEAIDVGGVDNYIVKPINNEEFIARVKIAAKRFASLKQETDRYEVPDSPEIKEQKEVEDVLKTLALVEVEKTSDDDGAPFRDDAITDNDLLESPPEKPGFDNLFDDEWTEKAEEKPNETKSLSALGFPTSNTSKGEDYFEDLFSDSDNISERDNQTEKAPKKKISEDDFDFFDDEPLEPPRGSQTSARESPLPGESADDFLFGDSVRQDVEKDPETVRHYAADEDPTKEKERKEDFIEGSFEEDTNDDSRINRNAMNRGKKNGAKDFFSIFGNIVFVSLLLMMAVLSFFLIQSRISGGVPQVAGYQMYIVLSGSMSPEFDTGSLAFVRETSPMEIVIDDIITFRSQVGSDSLTTHRVVEVIREDGLKFITKGDANNVNDPNPVPAENVVGRVTGSVPYVGYILDFVQTRQGLILLIFVPGVLIIAFELGKILTYLRQGEGNKNKKSKKSHSHPAEDLDI